MNFPGGSRGGGNKRSEEMSMEDILSSIRKYVSEEEPKIVSDQSDNGESGSYDDEVVSQFSEPIINLDQSNVLDREEPSVGVVYHKSSSATSVRNDSLRYNEQSDLSEEIVTSSNNKAAGPFDKLTDALRSYGKSNVGSVEKKGNEAEFIYNFVKSIIEDRIDKWIESNMWIIAEKAVKDEIEKMKSDVE
jgi:cell pole-organizing protein PopZ